MRRFLVAVALSGCASVVPSTAARLAAVNPLTADPAQIAVALVLPAGFAVRPGTAVLQLEGQRGAERMGGAFTLAAAPAPAIAAPTGTTVAAFRVAPADVPRIKALQATLRTWKAEGDAQGRLSVGVGGCTTAPLSPDAAGSVLIRLAAGEPFRPLLQDGRLADLVGEAGMAAIGPCAGPS